MYARPGFIPKTNE